MPVRQKSRSIRLDYPQPGEEIQSPHYTLRFAADATPRAVEVSIDDGPWRACREALGHWWFDWSGFGSGEHGLALRVTCADGTVELTRERPLLVRLSEPQPAPAAPSAPAAAARPARKGRRHGFAGMS